MSFVAVERAGDPDNAVKAARAAQRPARPKAPPERLASSSAPGGAPHDLPVRLAGDHQRVHPRGDPDLPAVAAGRLSRHVARQHGPQLQRRVDPGALRPLGPQHRGRHDRRGARQPGLLQPGRLRAGAPAVLRAHRPLPGDPGDPDGAVPGRHDPRAAHLQGPRHRRHAPGPDPAEPGHALRHLPAAPVLQDAAHRDRRGGAHRRRDAPRHALQGPSAVHGRAARHGRDHDHAVELERLPLAADRDHLRGHHDAAAGPLELRRLAYHQLAGAHGRDGDDAAADAARSSWSRSAGSSSPSRRPE